jgi:hypothetical protein
MRASFDPTSVFEQAIEEHLRVIETVHSQQPILEQIAAEMARGGLTMRRAHASKT